MIPKQKLNPLHIATLTITVIVVVAAIYAMTTWNDTSQTNSGSITHMPGDQLPDQSRAVNLQAQPSSAHTLSGGASGLQSASGSQSSSNDQTISTPTPPKTTSGVCGPPRSGKLSEVMCPY